MERKEFLKRLGLTAFAISVLTKCGEEDNGTSNNDGDCELTETAVEGPFPTGDASTLQITDITADREGVDLSINLTIKDQNDDCAVLQGAIVDIWHCDAEGNYSEYGGNQMQNTDYTDVHFLRGRQITDVNGLVTFQSIFPGWYQGRAPHIHVHVYDANGDSLVITQIAFPESTTDTVYTTSEFYSDRGTQDTTNSEDDIFNNHLDTMLADVTGSVSDGYTLAHTIVVDD